MGSKREVYLSETLLLHLQVNLHFTQKALRLIAKKAMAKNTGARGLRALLENILTEAMFEVSRSLFMFKKFDYRQASKLSLVSMIFY